MISSIKIVGLTGGIASGKSLVAEILRDQAVEVVDADLLAREVVAPGAKGLEKIAVEFGQEFVAQDGHLDRKRLSDRIFADPAARERLNALIHPLVADAMQQRFQLLAEQDVKWAVYEAPLLVENNLHLDLDALVVVSVPMQTQFKRLMQRDGLTAEQAQSRLDAQLPLSSKLAVADYVIDNAGSEASTQQQVLLLLGKLNKQFRQ